MASFVSAPFAVIALSYPTKECERAAFTISYLYLSFAPSSFIARPRIPLGLMWYCVTRLIRTQCACFTAATVTRWEMTLPGARGERRGVKYLTRGCGHFLCGRKLPLRTMPLSAPCRERRRLRLQTSVRQVPIHLIPARNRLNGRVWHARTHTHCHAKRHAPKRWENAIPPQNRRAIQNLRCPV